MQRLAISMKVPRFGKLQGDLIPDKTPGFIGKWKDEGWLKTESGEGLNTSIVQTFIGGGLERWDFQMKLGNFWTVYSFRIRRFHWWVYRVIVEWKRKEVENEWREVFVGFQLCPWTLSISFSLSPFFGTLKKILFFWTNSVKTEIVNIFCCYLIRLKYKQFRCEQPTYNWLSRFIPQTFENFPCDLLMVIANTRRIENWSFPYRLGSSGFSKGEFLHLLVSHIRYHMSSIKSKARLCISLFILSSG